MTSPLSLSRKTIIAIALFVNLIWAAHPVVGKVLLAGWNPFHVAWMRYVSAWCLWIVLVPFLRASAPPPSPFRDPPHSNWRSSLALMAMGALTFCLSPLLQFSGLQKTGALENAILISLEPTSSVFLAFIFLGERPRLYERWALALAVVGVFFLSGGTALFTGSNDRIPLTHGALGNLLILFSLLGEGVFSVVGRKLALDKPGDPISTFTRSLSWGVLFLSLIILPLYGLPDWRAFTLTRGAALFWIGPLGTTLCYSLWLRLLERVEVSKLALSLFVQPLLGALFGWLILGDSLTTAKGVGICIILGAMILTHQAES